MTGEPKPHCAVCADGWKRIKRFDGVFYHSLPEPCPELICKDQVSPDYGEEPKSMPQINENEYRKAHPERLRIYDVGCDLYRDATQEDLDKHIAVVVVYHESMKELIKRHNELAQKMGWPRIVRG